MAAAPDPGAAPPGVAVVTGAARGIGLAVARLLARRGHAVIGVHHRSDRPDDLDATWRRVDLADPDEVEALAAELAGRGDVEVLVTAAGAPLDAPTLRCEADRFAASLHLNLGSTVALVDAVLPGMVERGLGRIVLVSSAGAISGSPGQPAYSTAKAALHGLVRSLAVDHAADGVTVNALAPGPVDSELLRSLGDKRVDALRGLVPAHRLGRVDEVAAAAGFLAAREASFVNGVVLPVDGGLLASQAMGGPITIDWPR